MISVSEVMDKFDYCLSDGHIRWKIETHGSGGKIKPGDIAGTMRDNGYIQINVRGHIMRAHRLAFAIANGEHLPKEIEVDHINGIRHDNRMVNLRLTKRNQNGKNLAMTKQNKSGHKGVSFRKDIGKWHARITVDGRIVLLGNYVNIGDAVAARVSAEKMMYGKYSREHGFEFQEPISG